jgi:nitroreductase
MEKTAETQYPVHDLIARRWSPRALEPRPVPPDDIRSLLEAARWAASSFNEQPWTFLVARREDTDEFEKMLGCLVPGNRSWARNAGVLMLTVARQTFTRNETPNRVASHDLGLSVANLTFQATHLGLAVHQMGGIDLEKIRVTYAIPDGYEPVTGIAIGWPGTFAHLPEELHDAERTPRKRKPQIEFVFEGAWGRAADW